MALVEPFRWLVTTGDGGSWQKIADALGVTRVALWAANGLTGYRPLIVGEKLHVPFEE